MHLMHSLPCSTHTLSAIKTVISLATAFYILIIHLYFPCHGSLGASILPESLKHTSYLLLFYITRRRMMTIHSFCLLSHSNLPGTPFRA